MLGGGNPVGGANPAGTGSVINYLGNHAYVHSGIVAVQTSETVMAKFETQNAYIDAIIQFHYALNSSSDDAEYIIKINNETVVKYYATHSATDSTPDNEIYLILPPYSKIEFTSTMQGGSARDNTVTMRGRVYA